jgi:hypothetical protein
MQLPFWGFVMFESIYFNHKIAILLGDRKAQILEFILWSTNDKEEKSKSNPKEYAHLYHDGRWHMWDTHDAWVDRFPWMGKSSIRRYLKELVADNWIFTTDRPARNKQDRTLYYSINKHKYDYHVRAYAQNEQMGACAQNEQAMCSNRAGHVLKSSNSSLSNTQTNTLTKKRLTRLPKATIAEGQKGVEKTPVKCARQSASQSGENYRDRFIVPFNILREASLLWRQSGQATFFDSDIGLKLKQDLNRRLALLLVNWDFKEVPDVALDKAEGLMRDINRRDFNSHQECAEGLDRYFLDFGIKGAKKALAVIDIGRHR